MNVTYMISLGWKLGEVVLSDDINTAIEKGNLRTVTHFKHMM